MNDELDSLNEEFCRWAECLPKPAPSGEIVEHSRQVAVAELRSQDRQRRSFWTHAVGVAACWIAIGLLWANSRDAEHRPIVREPVPQIPDHGAESTQLLAEIYPSAPRFRPFF